MKPLESQKYITIKKAANGYICQVITQYGNDGEAEIFLDFADAIVGVAEAFGEQRLMEHFRESKAMTESLKAFFGAVVKPDLLAIEAKINPGIENIVNEDDECL